MGNGITLAAMPSRGQSEQQEPDQSQPGKPAQAKGGASTREPRTEEWLAVPPGRPNAPAPMKPAQPERTAPDLRDDPREPAPPEREGPDLRSFIRKELSEIRVRLAEVEAASKHQEQLLHEATEQARHAEERAVQAERRAEEAVNLIEKRETRTATAPTRSAGRRNPPPKEISSPSPVSREPATGKKQTVNGPTSINSADWDQLRELGLSVTDSARLLANREVRGGFSSLEELDELEEFPSEIVDLLKAHFRA
jgi:DNA uptake protein ComE-like DNA-binding protein